MKRQLRFSSDPRFRIVNPSLPMTRRQEAISDVAAGSTLQRRHSLPVIVTRYFTDVNGTILAKNDAGLVAAGMATDYPLFLLGEFDREGGYKIGLSSLTPKQVPGSAVTPIIYTTFVNGVTGTSNNIVTPFSPFNTIQAQLKQGDMCAVYVDSLACNYFCWIVQTNNYGALSSILSNLKSSQNDRRLGPLFCYEINWYAPETQWDQALHFIQADNLGTWADNQIQPYMFKTPFNVQQGFITVSTDFTIDQYMEIGTMFEIATDQMSFNFNIEKVN